MLGRPDGKAKRGASTAAGNTVVDVDGLSAWTKALGSGHGELEQPG
jgi:hypothetical protein